MAQFEEEARSQIVLMERFVDTSSGVPNGSRNRFGNVRANVGGRPRKLPVCRVGVEGPTDMSNRADPRRAPRRFELSGHAQVKLIDDVKARLTKAGGLPENIKKLWQSVRRDYPDVNKKRIKKMLAREQEIKERVAVERLGAGYGVTHRASGVRIVGTNEAKLSMAVRKSGAGRKFHLEEIMKEVKLWHDAERRMGHQVDAHDVRLEFQDRVQWHIAAEQSKKEGADLKKVKKWQLCIDTMSKMSLKLERQLSARLCKKMKVKLLTPSRYSQLTPTEERVRCELTWQQFDERMWIAAVADAKELSTWVADPHDFIKKRSETWLVFSDQIPFWVKIGFMKILFAEFELEKMSRKKLQQLRRDNTQMNQMPQSSTKLADAGGTADDAAAGTADDAAHGTADDAADGMGEMEGQTQKRGSDPAGEKCRITFEARQAVVGYFNGDAENGGEEPKSLILPSILVVKGAYARLSNIDAEGCFVKDESFWIGEQKIERLAGQSARGLMRSYVELRKLEPNLFSSLEVFQQPAAYMDEITTVWAIEDLARRCPQAVHQRDLFAAALGDTCKKAMQLTQVIPTWIASKMTPVLQLTDTDIAYPLKAAAARAKGVLSRQMRQIAEAHKQRASFHCGAREMMVIAAECHEATVKLNAQSELVLGGLRRNAMLVWRPDAKTGKLYDCSREAWCRELPVGSHRMKSSWLDKRKLWLKADGRPERADWSRSEHAETEADLAEASYVDAEFKKLAAGEIQIGGKFVSAAEIMIDCESTDLFQDADVLNQLHPKLRRAVKLQMTSKLSDPARKGARAAQKVVERERVQKALTELSNSWRDFLDGALVKESRAAVLSKLQPGVGNKSKKAKKSLKKAAWKPVTVIRKLTREVTVPGGLWGAVGGGRGGFIKYGGL